ncbi:MAG: hypothetical protein ABIN13_15680 [Mucilaginibacter sp.]
MYDSNLKAKWDYENSIAFAEEKAEERGIEKGIEKGEHKKALEVARKFKKIGVSLADIAKGTGLSISEIEKL